MVEREAPGRVSRARNTSEISMTRKQQKILMLCADQGFEELFRHIVPNCDLIVIQDIEGCLELINKKTFDMFILTNMNIPITNVIACVEQLPEKRHYKAFVMTGYADQSVIDVCEAKAVPIINLPVDEEEIRTLVSDNDGGEA